jgi:glutamate-1-semialdehyde 2,1-aminomutase
MPSATSTATTTERPDAASTSKSAEIFARAREVMPSGYTRHLVVQKPHPTYAASADGCWITDVEGRKRIDWVNNFSSLIHGHNCRPIVEMLAAQAGRLMSAVLPTEWEVELATILCDRIPSVERIRFMNSGTEANQIAIKAARAYTGKPKVAKMEGGYHGQFDLLEASFQSHPGNWGDARRPNATAYQAGHPQGLLDLVTILPLNDIEATREILRSEADQLAAVILDPQRLQLGMVEPSRAFLEMLREETERLGIILIFDEVWSLRAGYNGYQGKIGITPDLTTMGKIIGGGIPVGGCGGKREFMSVFEVEAGDPKIKHSGTFTANPLAMACGTTSLRMLTPEVFDRLEAQGERLREGLRAIRRDLGLKATVLGEGSLSGMIPTELPLRNYRELAYAVGTEVGARLPVLQKLLIDEDLLTMRGGFVGSTPMTDDDIDFTIAAARRAWQRFKEHAG